MPADPPPLVAAAPNGIHKMKLQSGLLPAGQRNGDHCAAKSTVCLRAVSVIGLLSPPGLTDTTGLLPERKTIVRCVRGSCRDQYNLALPWSGWLGNCIPFRNGPLSRLVAFLLLLSFRLTCSVAVSCLSVSLSLSLSARRRGLSLSLRDGGLSLSLPHLLVRLSVSVCLYLSL